MVFSMKIGWFVLICTICHAKLCLTEYITNRPERQSHTAKRKSFYLFLVLVVNILLILLHIYFTVYFILYL